MIKTKNYRNLISQLSGDKKKDKLIWKQINDIRRQYGMSEYSFYNDVKKMQQYQQFRIVKNQPDIHIVEIKHLGNKDRGGFGSTGTN